MKGYTRHIGKAGTYGECKVVEWKADASGLSLATCYHKGDGTVDVTLYTDRLVPHIRNIKEEGNRAWNICEAHVKVRGFTTVMQETSDVRAYND